MRCPAFTPPKIEINVELAGSRVDATKALAQMRAAGKFRHPAPIVGVYLGAVQYDVQIDDTMQAIPTGVCATPKYVTLKLSLEGVVYIPREFAADPCLRSLSQDHEAKHAAADVKTLDGERPTFEALVRAAIDRGTKNAAETPSDALGTLTHDIQTAADSALDEQEAARKRLDDAIDNPAALERLRTACGGRAAHSPGDATIAQ